jgi:hypothetical protein
MTLVAAASCSTTRYGDPKDTETVNIDWGSTDLQTMTGKMVESLKNSPALAYFDRPNKEADKRVITYMGGSATRPRTHQHARSRRDRTDLLQSGRFSSADRRARRTSASGSISSRNPGV